MPEEPTPDEPDQGGLVSSEEWAADEPRLDSGETVGDASETPAAAAPEVEIDGPAPAHMGVPAPAESDAPVVDADTPVMESTDAPVGDADIPVADTDIPVVDTDSPVLDSEIPAVEPDEADELEAGETTVLTEGWAAESSLDSTATLASETGVPPVPDRDEAGLVEATRLEPDLGGVADEADQADPVTVVPPVETTGPPLGEHGADEDAHDEVAEVAEDDDTERRSGARNAIEWVVIIAGALLAAFVIKTFLIQAFYIPSASMDPTLAIGDRVLVNKMSYRLHDVHRGDLIVFERPPTSTGPEKDLIKRVIGLPGETVESRGGEIFVNGRRLDEPYLEDDIPPGEPVERRRLPRDHYWVMGDNRASSSDSRAFGPIEEDTIIGRAFIRVWPIFDLTLL